MRRKTVCALTAAIVGAALIFSAAPTDCFSASLFVRPSLSSVDARGRPLPAVESAARPGPSESTIYSRRWAENSAAGFNDFRDWVQRYERSDANGRRALVAEGLALARQRRAEMRELIKRDPLAALERTVPHNVRRNMPAEVAAQLEQRISSRGHLTAIAAHAVEGHGCSFQRKVLLDDGRAFEAAVFGRRLRQMTEYNIWLHGIAVDGVMAVDESPVRVLESGEESTLKQPPVSLCRAHVTSDNLLAEVAGKVYRLCTLEEVSAIAAGLIGAEDKPGPYVEYPDPLKETAAATGAGLDPAWTLGNKKVLYLRVDFPDRPGAPIGPTEASNTLCGDVDRFYRDASFGRTRLECTVPAAVYRMPQPAAWYATNEFYWQMFLDAGQLAAEDGYNVDAYDRIFTVFTGLADIAGSRFTRAAWAFIGGKHVWLNGYFTASLTGHELGHNYGVHHANFWRTFDGSIVGSGATEEYGDPLDLMGTAPDGRGHFNPWFKNMLRWLDDADVQTVAANGIYRVHRFDHPDSEGIRALRVPRGDGRSYWIGLRQLFTNAVVYERAYIIWGYNRDSVQSDLLDMTPGSSGGQMDAGLAIGSTFEDTEAGLTIRPVAKGGVAPNEYLDIEINFFVVGLSDAIDVPSLNVSSGGSTPWRRESIIAHDNVDAAESGTLEDNEESWIETTMNGPGALTFWWKVSSEMFDVLEFFTNGVLVTQISGEVPWQQRTYYLGPGSHVLRWRYAKNASQSSGDDRAWLDEVSFESPPCTIVTLEGESASLVSPMMAAVSSQASDGEYIFSANENAGTAAWSIDLPGAGAYVIWCRVLASDTGSDSFFVSANNEDEDVYDVTRSPGPNWQWTRVNGRAGGAPWSVDPRFFNLAAGQNTIVFRGREPGARLDQLILTCDTNFVPADVPVITTQPESLDVAVGESMTLRTGARGFQPLSYQWQFNGENLTDSVNVIGARTPTLIVHNLQVSQSGIYTLVVTNRLGTAMVDTVVSVRPRIATFGVFADLSFVANTNVGASLHGLGFSADGFTNIAGALGHYRQIVIPSLLRDLGAELTASERAAVSNFVQYGGKLIVHGAFDHYGSALLNRVFGMNLVSSRQSGEDAPFTRMPGALGTEFEGNPSKVPIHSGTTALFTAGLDARARGIYERNGQAAVALWEWGVGAIVFLGWDWQNAAPSGTADGGWLSLLESAARQTVPLSPTRPVIVRQPLSQPAAIGQSVTFTARAEGSAPFFYQWHKDGVVVGGATNASFTIASVLRSDAGTYIVLVTNRFGSATSAGAVLDVVSSAAFTNSSAMVIPEGGNALPYPSRIAVSGLAGALRGLSVTLSNFSHTYPDDVDVLLVGPGGQTALLLSDAGGAVPVNGLTLTFLDSANTWIGDDGPLDSGVFRPTEYLSDDIFPPPAPRGPYGTGLDVFRETDPNGLWSLFVVDDAGGDDGRVNGGWNLRFWMDDDVVVSAAVVESSIVLQWPAATNRVYRVLYRDNLYGESWRPLSAAISIGDGVARTMDLLQTQRFYRVEVHQD